MSQIVYRAKSKWYKPKKVKKLALNSKLLTAWNSPNFRFSFIKNILSQNLYEFNSNPVVSHNHLDKCVWRGHLIFIAFWFNHLDGEDKKEPPKMWGPPSQLDLPYDVRHSLRFKDKHQRPLTDKENSILEKLKKVDPNNFGKKFKGLFIHI